MNQTSSSEPEQRLIREERLSRFGADALESAAGAAAGAAFGVLGGPVGIVAGAAFGAIVGAVLGHEAHAQENETTEHFDALEVEAESIREWRSSHPPPPPQPRETEASFWGPDGMEPHALGA